MKDLSVWLCDLTYTQQTVAADTIPMAIGCIAGYAEKKLGLAKQIQLFKYPEDLASAMEKQPLPDVIGFSNYCWNLNLSSEFAKVAKKFKKEIAVVFGGPNYPVTADERSAFLLEHPEIDYYVVGEGEAAFAGLIQELAVHGFNNKKICEVGPPSVHCVSPSGQVILTEKQQRLTDLDEIPSPYTSGRLDKFFDGKLMPLLQTNRGCPFSCTFCVEGDDYYNKIRKYSSPRISMDVEHMARMMHAIRNERSRNDLFIADSNFGMYSGDIDTAQALRRTKDDYGWPEYINVATGKNNKERVIHAAEILDGSLRLSGSVQSLDESVLENIRRKNISADQLIDLGLHAKNAGVNSYSEIILGLPGDSKQAHFNTIRKVMEAGFNIILPWQLMLINGSVLATKAEKNKYQMDARYRVFPRCFGSFYVLGMQVNCAEIEEVCVGNNTLSFDDYLDCRRLNLFVAIFYNDSIFSGLLKLFSILGIKPFDWIMTMMSAKPENDLKGVIDSFIESTIEELWNDKNELAAFCHQRETVQRYIKGDLGRNNLYYYRTLAITRHVDSLKKMTQEAALTLLRKKDMLTEDVAIFLEEMLSYHSMRIRGIFDQPERTPEAKFHFDFLRFEKEKDITGISDIRLNDAATYRFPLRKDQIESIKRNLAVHGNDSVGIARILSRVFVKKLYRQVEIASQP